MPMLPETRYLSGDERYTQLMMITHDTLAEERDEIAALATIAAYVNAFVERINWVGFYLLKGDTLVVGPYQGQPACTRIPLGKGVCGTAAKEGRAINVPDVHAFEGHIVCDAASRSEFVAPITRGGKLYGVLDVDSPEPMRFNRQDELTLTNLAGVVSAFLTRLDGDGAPDGDAPDGKGEAPDDAEEIGLGTPMDAPETVLA